MKDTEKKKAQLMQELREVQRQLAQLNVSETEYQPTNPPALENQALLAGVLDIAGEAIISTDETQQIILFNKGAEKIFGYSADEVIGNPLGILLPKRFISAHQDYIADFDTSAISTRLMGERQEIWGYRKNGEEFPAEASISKLEIEDRKIFTVVLRDTTTRKQVEQEREEHILKLKSLNEATRSISAELTWEQVLQKIVQAAQALIKVKYAALGMHDGQGNLTQFSTAGIEVKDWAKIGPSPVGRGLLGILFHEGKSMIVHNIADHPTTFGFPENHPNMRALLGVPIFSKGELIGALYLTDKLDGTDFTETDQQFVEMLALHAAIAIENARLYEQTQRLAILEERERFARDLHDSIIQSIYGVGLTLDQIKIDIAPSNKTAAEQIDLTLQSLAVVIQDLRNYIFDLRPQALKYQGLKARLEGLIRELRVSTHLSIEADISPDIDMNLSDMQARHIFHICHEALANAARHAKASEIDLSLARQEETVTLRIKDDGIGFEMGPHTKPGHRGLVNMYTRASEIGASLNIESVPRQGTGLTLRLRTGTQLPIQSSPD